MNPERMDHLVELARESMEREDFQPAKDRLRAILRASPHFRPALELMGHIYHRQADYLNAATFWSRADYWEEPMLQASEHVLKVVKRAVVRENARTTRRYLCAFAGSSPPADIAEKLSSLQSAYYKLDQKRSKFTGLACAPLSGGCLLTILGLLTVVLSAGWPWFVWTGTVAIAATIVVAGVNLMSYLRALRLFHEAVLNIER
jgi:hypothetical protein